MAKKSKPRRKRFITIFGSKIKIRYIRKLLHDDEGEQLDGAFDSQSMTIFVSTKSDINATIFHESLHAAIYLSGSSALLNEKSEEAVVCAIENGLKGFFYF